MGKVKHGRGWVLVEDASMSDEISRKLSERASHIYRDAKGNIINEIRCEGVRA